MRSPLPRALVALALAGALLFLFARTDGWSARGSPRPAEVPVEPVPEAPDPPSAAEPAGDPADRLSRKDPVALFDSDEVTRLLDLLLDPAHQAEEHVEERGRACNELRELVEKGGLPFVREALRRMQDRDPETRHRAQLLLALAKEIPPELLEDLRASADPLVFTYPDLRAAWTREPDTRGDGGVLGDAPLLDVAEDVRRRLWPGPEPAEGIWSDEALPEWENIRKNLLAWWKHIPAQDRFLLADDELLVVARDVARTWVHHNWRFVTLLRQREGRWHVAGFYRPDTENELVERVLVADFDGDGRRECAVWTTIVGGWTWGRLVVVGSGAPDGVATKSVYGSASEIRLVPPRRPGDPPRFGVCDVHLPSHTGHWGYLGGVIARECDLLEWTGTGFRSVGVVYLPLR